MLNIKLAIQYNGADYCGWQVQRIKRWTKEEGQSLPAGKAGTSKKKSIQETIENCLEKILQEKAHLIGSGRTDSGVHAFGQAANFVTSSRIKPSKIKSALNGNLPPDIRIVKSKYVPLEFHSRYWAKSRIYRYLILNQDYKSPFFADYSYWFRFPLDIKLMQEAASYLLGKHDFRAFCASGSSVKNTIRQIKKISITAKQFLSCKFISIEIKADGFLHNMVRNITGTLIEAGRKKIKPDSMKHILKSKNRASAGACVPAKGLYLVKVGY